MKLALALVPIILFGTHQLVAAQKTAAVRAAPCKVASDWVQQHPRAISANLDEFALFPLSYRRASYATMSMDERLALLACAYGDLLGAGIQVNAAGKTIHRFCEPRPSRHFFGT